MADAGRPAGASLSNERLVARAERRLHALEGNQKRLGAKGTLEDAIERDKRDGPTDIADGRRSL